MMAPEHERLRVLGEALEQATGLLNAPIESVRVRGGTIIVESDRQRVSCSFNYYNGYSEDGSVMPGSGHWSLQFGKVEPKAPIGWLTRLFER